MKKAFLLFFLVSTMLQARDLVYSSHFPVLPQAWYFSNPKAMDVGPDGNLYVVHGRNRVSVFSPAGIYLRGYAFYVEGYPDKAYRWFGAIAVDPSGIMYLGDMAARKLLKVDPMGNVVNSFWEFSVYGGDLDCDAQGNLYFLNPSANQDDPTYSHDYVYKFDPDGNLLLSFGKPNSPDGGGLVSAMEIQAAPNGFIYVSSSGERKLKIYDSQGAFQNAIDYSAFGFGPYDYVPQQFIVSDSFIVSTGGEHEILKVSLSGALIARYNQQNIIYCSDIRVLSNRIYVLDPIKSYMTVLDTNGAFLSSWQDWGTASCEFQRPMRAAVDHPGNVYVADMYNHRIQIFDKKWNLQMVIGGEGSAPGQFKFPRGVIVDDEGNIYVADSSNGRVQKFNKKGEFVSLWAAPAIDIDTDKDGFIYTLDDGRKKIQKFTASGQFVSEFSAVPDPDTSTLAGMGLDNQGRFYVAEYWRKVYVLDSQGHFLGALKDNDKLGNPTDVAVGDNGMIYVSDYDRRGVQFTPDGSFLQYFGDGDDVIKDALAPTGIAVNDQGDVYLCDNSFSRILVYSHKPGLKMTVPAAASIHGALGTDWRTDLSIFNPGSSAIDVTLDYYKADGPLSYAFTLQPSTFLSLPDVIGTTFSAPNTFGALTAVCLNDDQPLIFSRTYNLTEQGTYGQGIRASPYGATFYQGENAFLTGLKNTAAFRSNVGFFNLQDIPIEVQLVLYDEAGVELASDSYPLGALSDLQVNNIFSSLSLTGDHEAAWARVWTETLWGRFAAYGSIVDNQTGDPIYLEAKPLGGYMPEDFRWVLPAVASTPGAYGTNWRTETVFTNSLLESSEITLTYHPATGGDPFVETFTLEPGEVKSYSDFLGEAFALTESFGWLEIDSSCAGLQARARIFTGTPGTYGQGLQAQQQNALSIGTEPIYLLSLLENENYRSNLGLLNLSDTEMIFTLDLLKDSSVVSSKTLTLPAQTLQQLNGVLSSFFGTSGDGFTLRITGPEGAAYTAYLSTVDNRTGDAVYQSFSSQ